jgi:hypothetical protein
MKAHWITGIAMMACLSGHAGECTVFVYTDMQGFLPVDVLIRAQMKSAIIFKDIGVKLRWQRGAVPVVSPAGACGAPIVIRFEPTANGAASSSALAYAMPYAESGTAVHVILDRVFPCPEENPRSMLLAYVLTHEIAHVLEQVSRHSTEGIMKANWDTHDLWYIEWRSLPFAAEDVEMIHQGIAFRTLLAAK